MTLPPGTVLQHLYVSERLRELAPGTFVEVGTGTGELARLLLARGWTGTGYDLNQAAVDRALALNRAAIDAGKFRAEVRDWVNDPPANERADLVISSMVIEHLSDDEEARYFERCVGVLAANGHAIVLVPASPRHWGVEDDVAGHIRRYTREGITKRLEHLGWRVQHVAGLTFPLSNMLLPLSNGLVRRAEGARRTLSERERTRLSGDRHVVFKTHFPLPLAPVLNERALRPFHALQKAFVNHDAALVLYVEARPAGDKR